MKAELDSGLKHARNDEIGTSTKTAHEFTQVSTRLTLREAVLEILMKSSEFVGEIFDVLRHNLKFWNTEEGGDAYVLVTFLAEKNFACRTLWATLSIGIWKE